MESFYAVLLTLALFLALILSLTAEKRVRNRITGIAATAAAMTGILLYGSGFSYVLGFGPIALIRSLLAVCRMFGGVNDLSSIQNAPWFRSGIVMVLFWIGHFLAFYATASATVATLGGRLLAQIRIALLKRGELMVIFGINPESMDYGRSCMERKKYALLFVDSSCDDAAETAIRAMGGVVMMDPYALEPDERFIRRIGLRSGNRRLHIAAMQEDGLRNMAWAQRLQSALKQERICEQQTSLLLGNVPEQQAAALARDGGFGSVCAFDPYTLAARQMIRALPPCRTIEFDEDACGKGDFSAVIVGFGQMGRAVLQQLVMNGQFAGCGFRVDVFDEHPQIGSMYDSELLKRDIEFHPNGGKSKEFYDHLRNRHVSYIVLCTGNDLLNRELAQELMSRYGGLKYMPDIVQIGKNGLLCSRLGESGLDWQKLYNAENLDLEKADRLAMIINQQYCSDNGKSAEENWKNCDYFSRISCRASADFAPSFLWMIGCEHWTDIALTQAQIENLSRTEHMRWQAFHEVMGWRPMPQTVWQSRANAYLNGDHSIRIGKDSDNHLHACMIPWDDLDELSDRENSVTGGHVDYKAMDRNNVLALGELLKNAEA